MQRRDRFIAAVLIVLVFISSAIAYGASVNDPAWNKVVAAAKKEGKVVIIGPAGSDVRDAYTIGDLLMPQAILLVLKSNDGPYDVNIVYARVGYRF